MNTQERIHRLEAGQALPFPRRGGGSVVLSEGELLVQEPARWLAEMFVQPAAVRLVAPAVLPMDGDCTVVALQPSCVLVREPAPRFSAAQWRGWLANLRWRGREGAPSNA